MPVHVLGDSPRSVAGGRVAGHRGGAARRRLRALLFVNDSQRYQVGAQVLSLGVGFQCLHVRAATRLRRRPYRRHRQRHPKLTADGGRPKSVGFWFALGHSAMVVVLALLVLAAAKTAGALLDDGSSTRRMLGLAGTLASGGFSTSLRL